MHDRGMKGAERGFPLPPTANHGTTNEETMNYRILSLDGGGTWALIQVKALIEIYSEKSRGRAVLEDFDLVAANSGGSIVLGGLVENLTLAELLAEFEDEEWRKSVFSPTESVVDQLIRFAGVGPKYNAAHKLPVLQRAMPTMGDVPLNKVTEGIRRPGARADVHLLITAFDYDRNRATFFRSADTNAPNWGTGDASEASLAEAIHASTNAPVNYFDAPAEISRGRYWDGAISACNNPVLAAVTEAITLSQSPTDIVALAIGTGSVLRPLARPGEDSPLAQPIGKPCFVNDLRKVATAILDDPPDVATFLAHVMTGGGRGLRKPAADSRIVRMSPLISSVRKRGKLRPECRSITDEEFEKLANLDLDVIQQSDVDLISRYADLWLDDKAPNQPIRMNGDTFEPELGQKSFKKALAAWKAIR